jgi:ATP-dependent DNA helicase RecQ
VFAETASVVVLAGLVDWTPTVGEYREAEPRTLVSETTRPKRTTKRAPRRKKAPAKTAVAAEAEETAPAKAPRRKKAAATDPVSEAAARLGIEQLHPEQEEAISNVLDGRDVLMILPTGFGKSACYQVPSMVMKKPVVMISPLLALLKDQHDILVNRGIDCVRIDGSVRAKARREALERITEGGPLLVMTTPETLAVDDVSQALEKTGVGLAAVDEAHCISEWGHDFRPAYRRLGKRLRSLGGPPILALTATATPRVREAIMQSLGLREPHLISSSPHRSNLAFEVIHCEGDMRLRALIRLLKRLRRPGIVYCSTRREVDTVYAVLRRFNIPAHRYHGAMTATERNDEQRKFMNSRNRSVMAATSAFGLGIDKKDIRYILHYQAPASLEQYVQEAGRGGRDGKKANCILLNDSADRKIHEALLARSRVRPEQLYRLGMAIAAWSDEDRNPSMEALALSADLGPRTSSALLTKVEEAGLVEIEDKEVRVISERSTIEADVNSLAGQFETLKTQDGRRLDAIAEYAHENICRAVYLRGYFGEQEAEDDPCGLCDVCRGRPDRPDEFFAPLAPPPTRKKKGRKKKRGGRRTRRTKPTEAQKSDSPDSPDSPEKPRRRRRGRGRRKKMASANSTNGAASPASPTDPDAPAKQRRRRRRRRRGGNRGEPKNTTPDAPSPRDDA